MRRRELWQNVAPEQNKSSTGLRYKDLDLVFFSLCSWVANFSFLTIANAEFQQLVFTPGETVKQKEVSALSRYKPYILLLIAR